MLIAALATLVGAFHVLNVSGIIVLSTMIVRITHISFMMTIAFLSFPLTKKSSGSAADHVVRVILALATVAGSLYMLIRWQDIASSGGLTSRTDAVVGFVMIFVVLEATRRSVGLALAIIAAVFLVYPFVGQFLPGMLYTRTIRLERLFTFLFTTSEGIYGIPIGVSSTYIVLFCIYGAFLSEFGAGDFFYTVAKKVTRNLVAASAKTAVVFSTLIGMISGSAAGNVAVAGVFAIPWMKKEGYKDYEAGAIEALVSTGGQIMPPIMGAAAFIMAEILGVAYMTIMKTAIIPALLFFASTFIIVHLLALRNGIGVKSGEEKPEEKDKNLLENGVHFLVPFITLLVMMFMNYSPFKAAYWSILALLVVNIIWNRKIDKVFIDKILKSLKDGATATVPLAIACAAAGILSGVLSVTGLGSKMSGMIVSLSMGIPFLALVLTMIVAIILGMGLPTTAAYLILATVIAPALTEMGIPALTAHMFVFFYGCLSTITPPVALASYVAAGIAGADVNKVGWTAFKYGIATYILPFMFVYGPALLMQGTVGEIVWTIAISLVGVYSLAAGVVGYLRSALPAWARIALVLAGLSMISQGLVTDLIGVAVFAAIYLVTGIKPRQAAV
ncbi:MAG: TRAP transporter [Spirochaetes bacterium RIFOXYC1_FULL_54_7]|nr:MAG: TRAP transporter [Spirochaetes bacterium RIFOXYC1_FULL_54_7]